MYRSISYSNDYLLDRLRHIKADALRELSTALSMSVTAINAQKPCSDIPESLECFKNLDKFMTQFARRRGNQPRRSATQRAPMDGLSF